MASLVKRPDSSFYQIQFYCGGKIRRVSTATSLLQIAKEKLRQFESARARGEESPLPTRTPISFIVADYVKYMRATKTSKSAQTDTYYLREMFGKVCSELETRRQPVAAGKKRPPKPGGDRRLRAPVLQASCFEEIKAADISTFISTHMEARSLAPKTANRYREILCRLFNWATEERGVRLPGRKNPAAQVRRYREAAPRIRFLTLAEISNQLDVLKDHSQIQTMVAMLIYAGLRREELLWLTVDDVDYAAGANGLIRVRAKEVQGAAWEPKTKANRAVPISRALRGYLDKYEPTTSTGRWFFPTLERKRWNPDWFSETLRCINKEAGLDWSNLDFRHTFGSQLAMKGESLYKIATLMGNSPEICRRHYAALIPEAMSETVEFSDSCTTSGL